MNAWLQLDQWRLARGAVCVCAGLLLAGSARAQSLHLGSHVGLAGGVVRVPVLVSYAPALAAVSLTLNFDPQILTLTNVAPGSLGAFNVELQSAPGSVRLAAVQPEALTNASGTFAVLEFQVAGGVPAGSVSPLTIADRSLSGAAGRQLEWTSPVTHTDGSFTVVTAAQDADANGLPDWWEDQEFGSVGMTSGSADSDHDGISNRDEYLAGTNPLDAASRFAVTQLTTQSSVMSARFNTAAGKSYQLQRSANLHTWITLPEVITGNGAPAEVTISIGPPADLQFYRIKLISP